MATQTTEIGYPPLDSQAVYSFIEANVAVSAQTGDLQTDFKQALLNLLQLSGRGYSIDDLWKRYQLSAVVTGDGDVQGPPSRTPPGHGGQHPGHFLPPGRLRNPNNTNGFPLAAYPSDLSIFTLDTGYNATQEPVLTFWNDSLASGLRAIQQITFSPDGKRCILTNRHSDLSVAYELTTPWTLFTGYSKQAATMSRVNAASVNWMETDESYNYLQWTTFYNVHSVYNVPTPDNMTHTEATHRVGTAWNLADNDGFDYNGFTRQPMCVADDGNSVWCVYDHPTNGWVIGTAPTATPYNAGSYVKGSIQFHLIESLYGYNQEPGDYSPVQVTPDGKKLYFMSNTGVIRCFEMSTAFDITTMSHDPSNNFTADETTERCFWVTPDNKIYTASFSDTTQNLNKIKMYSS